MSTTGSTALIRLASNPTCEILSAMVMEGGSETRFYERVTGEGFDREFGERQSSRRRGAQFEANAYAGDARLLREALTHVIGLPPDDIQVRNMLDDFPGIRDEARIARLGRTRQLLKSSLEAGAPHIIIQPQLLIPTQPGTRPYFFLSPDLLVWSQEYGCYLVGDLKSFVVRENELDPSDLSRVRLQLGAQARALQHEYDRLHAELHVPEVGLLIFSQPNGLRPHAPRLEDLGGAIAAIRLGIEAYLQHRSRIRELAQGEAPHSVVDDLVPHFQESCLSACVMAQWCRRSVEGLAADLGDRANEILGEANIVRLVGLMDGTIAPANDQEGILANELRQIDLKYNGGQVA